MPLVKSKLEKGECLLTSFISLRIKDAQKLKLLKSVFRISVFIGHLNGHSGCLSLCNKLKIAVVNSRREVLTIVSQESTH